MEMRKLGNSNIEVSRICLGTMTWGEQNTEAEAFEQMDFAINNGVNFFDAAEMYPVPPKAETCGLTETYIGNWFKKTGNRENVILATKATGPGDFVKHIRGGPKHTESSLRTALEGSLKRLQTDVIDLYQIHWPERKTNYFGQLGYIAQADSESTPLRETLSALKKFRDEGKIRTIGLSNETPWGAMQCLELSKELNLPRVVSIQNPYNLLNRTYEIGLAEVSYRENCGLLAYSPLAFGVLSGKYQGGAKPPKARLTLFKRFSRYTNSQALAATERYLEVARRHELDPAQMAIAFVNAQPFLTSNIIGATTMDQLEANILAEDLKLSKEIIKELEVIHREMPNPAP
jgi:aryl-alcohol dehydrogenase-like predicted oxidoreductase